MATNQGGGADRWMSLEQVDQEMERVGRDLEAARQAVRSLHQQSQQEDWALKEMGNRAKSMSDRSGFVEGRLLRRSNAELKALRAEIKARSEVLSQTMQAMQAKSAEARELTAQHQALSNRRAQMMHQQG